MPILDAEPTLFPENLLDIESPIVLLATQSPVVSTDAVFTDTAVTDALDYDPNDPSGRSWSAMHTRSRQEKSLARELLAYQIPFYLPLVPKTNLIRGRKVESYIPLFCGYLFLFATPDERERCLRTNRVCQTIAVKDGEALTRDLRNIRSLIDLKAPLTIESQLTPGRRVRILNGSLMGMEGTVVERRRETRLVVAVQFLQQGVSLEIDDFQLEPID